MQQIKHHHRSSTCTCRGQGSPTPCLPGCAGQALWGRGAPGALSPLSPTGHGQRGAPCPPTRGANLCPQLSATKTKRPFAWPRATTLCLSLRPGYMFVSPSTPPGCCLLNFFLPLHLSVYKLATNAFQVVVISLFGRFQGTIWASICHCRELALAGCCPLTVPPQPPRAPTGVPGGTCPR